MRYPFIQDTEKAYPVTVLCQVMKVSRGGYYRWKTKDIAPSRKRKEDLLDKVRKIHKENHESYGARRIATALTNIGHKTGRSAACTLMIMAKVKAKQTKKFKVTTDSKHNLPISPNLLNRDFHVDAPDKVWVADITYIWTSEGWLFLAVIIDLFSRRIVGWETSNRINKKLVVDALKMAYWRRKPQKDLVFHTDRGSQYCSGEFQGLLKTYRMKSSMSRKGDCWDNAVAESFFATLKKERIMGYLLLSRNFARRLIFNYIEIFYNGSRFHSYLGNVSPRIFEERWGLAEVA